MLRDEKKEKIIEWSARILVSVHFYKCISGMIAFWQTKYQLTSPLIPSSTIEEITEPYWKASLIVSATFIIAIWAYFFRKRIAAIIASAISITVYPFIVQVFAQ
jgi:hypothetical protein